MKLVHHGNWGGKIIKPLSVADAAYIAGIMDGEGSICISRKTDSTMKRGYCYRLHVTIANTDLPLVEWLMVVTGLGKVYTQKRINQKHKQAYHWNLWSIQAYQVLKEIYPYLRQKKERAKIGMAFIEAKNDGVGRNGLSDEEWASQASAYDAMKVLNRRGTW